MLESAQYKHMHVQEDYMTQQREAWFIPSAEDHAEAVRYGLAWLDETSRRIRATICWLVGVSKDSIANGVVADVLGREPARRFVAGAPLQLPSRVRMNLVTMNRLPVHGPGGPVLAVHIPPKVLTRLDDISDIPALCAIPWVADEYDAWSMKWHARSVFDTTAAAPDGLDRPPQMNPVVVEALRALTSSVNLGTGIVHPRDHAAAVWMFRTLRDAHETIDFGALPHWLVEHHWRSEAAEELTQMGKDIYAGKRLRAGANPWRDGIVRQWRQLASDRGTQSAP
jgi:hypothetical protein